MAVSCGRGADKYSGQHTAGDGAWQWDWTLRLKDEPERITGRIGLYLGENNRGFWMGLPWQGRGLMTEAVIAVTDYWFDVLGFRVLRAPKAVENVGSRRISEKTGMRVVETRESDYVSGTLPTEVWEITADEWRTWRATHGMMTK
jgi:ribosomal-protein-alanine N-acetyltransferase